ncbi:MAG: hypothetical protein JWP58_1039 [Hymenobacter sp.]|nr:hypothetical protein [Hymenobacter sp.]
MRFLPITLGGLLLAATLPARAQTTAETPPLPGRAASRFYAGLGAYSSYYQRLGSQTLGYGGSFRLPVQLTAGYQLSPRLAVQVGVAYSGATAHYAENTLYQNATTGPNPNYYTLDGTYTLRHTSVSALARYTLTANPAHRLQFDALGGFTLERRSSTSRGIQTNYTPGAAATTANYDFGYTRNTLLLTGGVGARYRLSRRFELTYDFTVSQALNDKTNAYGTSINYTNALTASHALGLRYRLGR